MFLLIGLFVFGPFLLGSVAAGFFKNRWYALSMGMFALLPATLLMLLLMMVGDMYFACIPWFIAILIHLAIRSMVRVIVSRCSWR